MQGALKNAGSFLSRVSSQVTGAENGNLSKKAKERLEEALKKGDIDVVQEVLGDGSEVKVNKIRFGFVSENLLPLVQLYNCTGICCMMLAFSRLEVSLFCTR